MERTLPRTRSCFVCGVANPRGLNLEFTTDGQIVTARFQPRAEHIGFKGVVHGGLVSTVLDEAMVWACGVRAGRFAYCAELSVRFRRPVPPAVELRVVGELTDNHRDKLYLARAELRDAADTLMASATGKYVPLPPETLAGMLDDFVGDIRALHGAAPGGTAAAGAADLSESRG
jgi:uncharacterized protein (TIGR00369 family)